MGVAFLLTFAPSHNFITLSDSLKRRRTLKKSQIAARIEACDVSGSDSLRNGNMITKLKN